MVNLMRYRLLTLLIAASVTLANSSQAADIVHASSFDAKGVIIHYWVQGEGEPVILIHALHASADKTWMSTGIMKELAITHRVISFDMPGHGRSDRPVNEEAYGAQLVEDVRLLLDHLNIEKAHIAGYAIGGVITMKFLATHPDRAITATIGGTGWFRARPVANANTIPPPPDEPDRTPRAFDRSLRHLETSEEELLRIRVPVKVIIGDRDVVKRLYLLPLKEARPDWPVVEIEGAGHVDCFTKPQFQVELANWIRRNSRN